jgi:hypothetical protein
MPAKGPEEAFSRQPGFGNIEDTPEQFIRNVAVVVVTMEIHFYDLMVRMSQ